MEVLGENKKNCDVKMENLLNHFNIPNDIKITDYLLNCPESYNLDIFPFVIKNHNKYRQVEIFYQKCLDGDLSKHVYENIEYKYHQFMKTLWLYNEVYVQTAINKNDFKISYYAKKNKSKFSKSKNFLLDMFENFHNVKLIDSVVDLESLLFIATREISPVLFYFLDFKVIVYLNACNGIVYFADKSINDKVFDVAKINQLYLIKRNEK